MSQGSQLSNSLAASILRQPSALTYSQHASYRQQGIESKLRSADRGQVCSKMLVNSSLKRMNMKKMDKFGHSVLESSLSSVNTNAAVALDEQVQQYLERKIAKNKLNFEQ